MRTTVYVHGSKDSLYETGKQLGMTGEVLRMFSHACGEFAMELEVDLKTGSATLVGVDGRKLEATQQKG